LTRKRQRKGKTAARRANEEKELLRITYEELILQTGVLKTANCDWVWSVVQAKYNKAGEGAEFSERTALAPSQRYRMEFVPDAEKDDSALTAKAVTKAVCKKRAHNAVDADAAGKTPRPAKALKRTSDDSEYDEPGREREVFAIVLTLCYGIVGESY
jgi:hypothetical protein